MANLLSFPWQGTTPGSAGPYSAAQFAEFIDALFRGSSSEASIALYSNHNSQPAGLLYGFGFDVSPNASPNMTVIVAQGAAVVNGTYVNGTPGGLNIGSNTSGNSRIDTVCIHLDYIAQTANVQVNQGTPSGTPVPPTLTQSASVWEVPLADVLVVNNATQITQSNITPRAVPSNPPLGLYMPVLNNSGATLVTGDVVVWDNTAQQAVKTSTTANDPTVAGVVVGRIGASRQGIILVKGVGYINTNGAITNGVALVQSTTAKQAAPSALYAARGAFAYAMSTTTGAGLMPAFIDASQINQSNLLARPIAEKYWLKGSDYTLTMPQATWTALDTTNMLITHTTYSGKVKITIKFTAAVTYDASNTINGLFDISIDSKTYSGSGSVNAGGTATATPMTNGLANARNDVTYNNAAYIREMIMTAVVTGLAAGSHTYELMYTASRAGGAGNVFVLNTVNPYYIMVEEL